MDIVTYTLAGYILSRAGWNRFCPKANALLVLAANAPGIDRISLAGGDVLALEYQRGVTHSVFSLPILALVPVAVVVLFSRGAIDWRKAWPVSAIGVACHLILDWAGGYGARLMYPLSDRWYHLDALPETDVVILGILILTAGWLSLAMLVKTEIGAASPGGRGAAIVSLALVSFWIGGRCLLHERAVATADAHLYAGEPPVRVAAFPHYADPFRWRVLAETEDSYHVLDIDIGDGELDPDRGLRLFKAEESGEIQAATASAPVRTLADFARYPFWRVAPSDEADNASRVELVDLQFAVPGEDRFVATAIVDPAGEVLRSWFSY